MRIYLQTLDSDVWLSVENGLTNNKFNEQAKEAIMKGLSKSDIEKVIIKCNTTKELWNELHTIYDIYIQAACDVKSVSLKNGAVKDSKSIEDHASEDDSLVSRGQVVDQHTKDLGDMQSSSKMLFCYYCRTIGHLSSSRSIASFNERESCSSSSKEEITLIEITNLNIVQEVNRCTSCREEDKIYHVLAEEPLELAREHTVYEIYTSCESSSSSFKLEVLEEKIYLKNKLITTLDEIKNIRAINLEMEVENRT